MLFIKVCFFIIVCYVCIIFFSDILKPFVHTDNPEILELFARYLLPNTTSVGYEPLKWQHLSLYELVTDK